MTIELQQKDLSGENLHIRWGGHLIKGGFRAVLRSLDVDLSDFIRQRFQFDCSSEMMGLGRENGFCFSKRYK